MAGLTRSDVFGRSLKIHNNSNNVLLMNTQGELSINTKSINSNVKESISLISNQNIDFKTIDGNITTNSINGNLIFRNGTYNDINSLSYTYDNFSVNESADSTSTDYYSYFTDNLINQPYTTKESVVALRDGSLLIESLGGKKITLYSNNGINNICAGDMTSITDNDYIVQANRKINLTSLGFISMNCERLVSSVEEDISLFSSTGSIILGGNGITNNGLMVNSIGNNNFTGFGKTGTAQRSIDVEINHSSNDNINKNGIKITNNTNSNNNSVPINPEIELGNSTTNIKLDMGVGADHEDINLKVICKKVNIDGKTYILILNNFNFNVNDVGKVVTWNNSSDFNSNKILKIINDTTSITGYPNGYGIIANINTESISQINSFGYQIGYINRNNFGYLKTKTGSDLSLGTNKKHILNITTNGHVGINTNIPDASCQIKNTYGTLFNNNIEPDNTYSNGRTIQLTNGNIVLVSNSRSGATYSLMGFIYNDTDVVIQSFTIVSGSSVEIQYGVDNLVDDRDLFVVCYSYKKTNSTSILVYFTESNVYKNDGTVFNSTLKNTIEHDNDLNQSSYPNVKSFKFTNSGSGLDIEGYAIVYNDLIDLTSSDKVNTYVQVFSNTSPGNILAGKFDVTEDLYPVGGNSKLNNDIVVDDIITRINKYIGIEVNTYTNTILIVNYSRVEDDTSNIYHQTYLHRFILSLSSTIYSLTRKKFDTDTNFIKNITGDNHTSDAQFKEYIIEGADIKLVQTTTNLNQTYIISFYKKNLSSVRQEIYTKKIIFKPNYDITESGSFKEENLSDLSENSLIVDVPFISKKTEDIYILGWINVNTIKYLEQNLLTNTKTTKTITSDTPQQIFILCLKDSTGIYKETIVSWNNNDTNDTINYQSVSLKKILSSFNIFSVKNENIDFKLTNEGVVTLTNSDKINLNESLEIDKVNNKVNILAGKDLVISSNSVAGSGTGVEGQFNYNGTNLYIYLGGAWKQVTLT
jgi:hypothetical protein